MSPCPSDQRTEETAQCAEPSGTETAEMDVDKASNAETQPESVPPQVSEQKVPPTPAPAEAELPEVAAPVPEEKETKKARTLKDALDAKALKAADPDKDDAKKRKAEKGKGKKEKEEKESSTRKNKRESASEKQQILG